jgi:predicted CoA-substrate-specific enzyme activase
MSCGLNFLREEVRGDKPLHPQKTPLDPLSQTLSRGLGGEFEGRAGELPSPGPPLKNTLHQLAYGLDFGSRSVKLVYPRMQGGVGRRRWDSITFYQDYLVRDEGQLAIAWERVGLPKPAALVATGYGKNLLKAHFATITEIRAHFLGARSVTGLDHFILLEMGGQDTKVLYIREGRVFDFLTNDRCAAGTGRYLENMARFLKMPLSEFAGYWQDPTDVSQTCAIFGETELVGHLLEGVAPARIAAGVNASVARRALAMLRRYRCPTLVFVGGVARNRAMVRLLQDLGAFQVIVPPFPQFNGALGCALEAARLPVSPRPMRGEGQGER